MAAPSITLGTSYFQATSSSSHTVNLPAGTAYKGVWIVTLSGTAHTVSGPAGWTLKLTVANTTARKLSLLTSDATTSATSVAISTTQTTIAAAVGFSTDGNLASLVAPTGVSSSGTTPDPPASGTLTSGDYRIMALAGYWDARRTISGYPTNYADNQLNVKGTLNNEAAFGFASRGMTGITSEDPGTFSLSATLPWSTATVAIPATAVTSWTGTIASTLGVVVADLAGEVDNPPGVAGSIASTFDPVTADLTGTFTTAPLPGDIPTAAVIAIYDARTLAGAVNDPVAAWADSGPLAQANLVQGTSANRPVIDDSGFGGIRSVKFDGVNDHLEMTLASTYSGDFAFLLVCELLTYPSSTAGVFYSGDAIPNKNILGVDDVEDPPGWVIMSSNDGTQAQHHHGTASQTYLEAVPSRFVMTQLVRNDGEHKLWENADLVVSLTDSSGENSDLNNLTKLKLGKREDNSRPVNGRIAYVMLIDMAFTDEATLLDARDELGQTFAVPGFEETAWTGTIATTLGAVTADLNGAFTPPPITGSITSTLGSVTADLNGTVTAPVFSGPIASTLGPVVANLDGTRTVPQFTGVIASTLGPVIADLNGTFVPVFTGNINASFSAVTADLNGTRTLPQFTGVIASIFGPVTADLNGTFVPVFTGVIASTLGPVSADLVGDSEPPHFNAVIASTLGSVSADLNGTFQPPLFSGLINSSFGSVTANLDGTTQVPVFTGTITSTLGSVTADLNGTRTLPAGAGVLEGNFAPVVADLNGTFVPHYHGTVTATLGPVTADLNGIFDAPGFDGIIQVTLGTVTADLNGEFDAPVYTGTIASSLGPVIGDLNGIFDSPGFDGTIASTLGPVTGDLVGTFVPHYHGSITATFGSVIGDLNGTFVGGVVGEGNGRPFVWTGSAWVEKPVKVWTGSTWEEKPMKVWTGSEWEKV